MYDLIDDLCLVSGSPSMISIKHRWKALMSFMTQFVSWHSTRTPWRGFPSTSHRCAWGPRVSNSSCAAVRKPFILRFRGSNWFLIASDIFDWFVSSQVARQFWIQIFWMENLKSYECRIAWWKTLLNLNPITLFYFLYFFHSRVPPLHPIADLSYIHILHYIDLYIITLRLLRFYSSLNLCWRLQEGHAHLSLPFALQLSFQSLRQSLQKKCPQFVISSSPSGMKSAHTGQSHFLWSSLPIVSIIVLICMGTVASSAICL